MYTEAELKKLLKRPRSDLWSEWRCWAVINTLLATGIRANPHGFRGLPLWWGKQNAALGKDKRIIR